MKKIFFVLVGIVLGISAFAKSYSLFCKENSYGIIDENRKVLLPPKYSSIYMNDYSIICHGSEHSVDIFDRNLKPLSSLPEKSDCSAYSEFELIIFKPGDKFYSIWNLKTGEVKPHWHDENLSKYYLFVNNLAVAIKFGSGKPTFAVINRNNEDIVQNLRQAANNYSEGLLAVVLSDGKSGFIDEKGKLVLEVPLYEDYRNTGPKTTTILNSYSFNEGVALIQTEKDRWSIVDKKANILAIPSEYELVTRSYSNGLVVVKNGEGKYGYMDKNARLKIPCRFSYASNFTGKYAPVRLDERDAVIDVKGNIYYSDDL